MSEKRGGRRRAEKWPGKHIITGLMNETRTQILAILNRRVASQSELAKELGLSHDKIRYELGVLKGTTPPLIKEVAQKSGRGGVQRFYAIANPTYFDQSEWLQMPPALKGDFRGALLDTMVRHAIDAIDVDAFDSLDGAHMSWVPLVTDPEGWKELVDHLVEALEGVLAIKDRCAKRLSAKDAVGVPCAVAILGHPSAEEPHRVGPPPDAEPPDKPEGKPKRSR